MPDIGDVPDPDYPLPAFHFALSLSRGGASGDASFMEASGIGPEMQTETVIEGGENRFVHVLPGGFKHPRLVLKRGITRADTKFGADCWSLLSGGFANAVVPYKAIYLMLLDANATPVRTWSFENAYPVKWSVDPFGSTKNSVAVDSIEFSYTNVTLIL
ncbi:phage tail protein [Derxia lacustris]|uniref:phage tail protein n=1 Tax=Derxia lacustris TaxID=764842 RepID=UPI000A16E802|nr:phage tail protein [Derxia lacustris]